MKRLLAAGAMLCLSFSAAAEAPAVWPPMPEDDEEPWLGATSRQACVTQRGQSRDLRRRPAFPHGAEAAAELAKLVDATLCKQFTRSPMAGAAVAVVDHGQIVFSSGYFYADYAAKKQVDPLQTMFRIGSISKLFTWTSVMQLVDDKRVSLTADINDYLMRLKIPADFAQTVTLKNLMTHTAGFEENFALIGVARSWAELPTLEETIERHVPARVQPPATDFTRGEQAAYSNWGGALAGYIVAQQSGKPFDDYVEERIFNPLNMKHSSFRESASPDPAISQGYYRSETKALLPCGFEYVHGLGPAGSGSVSAEDMAHFMVAHLQDGRYGDRWILKEETARLMHRQALRPHPDLAGAAYGFKERYVNGRRLLWHDGATRCFYSEMYLFPEENIGLFVAYNTIPSGRPLMQAFMDRYFWAERPAPPGPPAGSDKSRLTRYAGYYRPTSRARESWERVLTLVYPIRVGVTEPGALEAPQSPGSKKYAEWILVPETPGLVRRADGRETMALLETEHGDAYIIGPQPFAPMVKLHWYETQKFNGDLLGLCWLGFLLAIVLALAHAPDPGSRPYRWAWALAAAVGVVNLAILLALRMAWLDPGDLTLELPCPLVVAMDLSFVSVLLALALLLVVAHGWRRPDWTPVARWGFALLTLPDAVFLGWLCFWNLIGRQLG